MPVPVSQAEVVSAPSGTGTTIAITLPSHQEDDVLIVQVGWKGNQAPQTLTGWNLHFSNATGTAANGCGQGVWWRRVNPSETVSNPTLTIGTTAVERRAIAYCIRGADIDNPANTFWQKQQSVGNSATPTPAGVTTLAPNYLLLHLVTCRGNSAITPPTGYNEEQDSAEGTTICVEGSTKTQATAATVSGQAASISSNRWVAAIIAIPSPDYCYFRAQTSTTATGTSVTGTLPTNTTQTDFYDRADGMLAIVKAAGSGISITADAAWTNVASWDLDTSSGSDSIEIFAAEFATGRNLQFTRSGSGNIAVQLITYRNIHQTAFIGNSSARQNAGTPAPWDATNRGSTKSTMIGIIVCDADTNGVNTAPAGYAERSDGLGIAICDQVFEASGSTASANWTTTNAANVAGMIEILSHAGEVGVSDLPLTFSDSVANLADDLSKVSAHLKTFSENVFNLDDALTVTIEYRISFADDANALTDGVAHALGIENTISDTLEALADAQSQLLGQLSALSDSLTAVWGDALDLALAHLLAFSDDAFSLNDAALLNLEQREQFSDSLAFNDVIDLILTHQLTFTDSSYGLPATPLLDNFNRADEDPATGWTQVFTSASNIHVFNNQVSGHSIDLAYGVFTALTPGDEQEAYVSISTGQVSGGGSGNQAYLLLRFTGETSDAATGYLVNAFSTFIRVFRVDALASFDLLTTQDIGIALTAGDKLGARMRGDLLEVWTNIQNAGWNRVDTVTDSTYPSGKIGVGIRTLDNTLLLDDFGGGTVTGGLTDFFAHQLAISDTGVLNLPLSDSLSSLDDSLLLGYGLVLAEDVANLTDSQTGELSYFVTLDDSVTFQDSVALTGGYLVTFNDSFALIDTHLVSLEHRQSFNDSITLTDAEANQLGQLSEFTDTVGLSDDIELLLAYSPLFADAIVISDSIALLMTHALALDDDVNLLIDSLQTDTPQGPEILVGVTDAFILTDALQVQLNQLLTLSDNAANWADFLAKTVGIDLILNDNAANLTDDYAALLTHGLAVFDALTLTDSLATFGENYLQVTDSFALADEVDIDLRGPDVNLDLNDLLTFSDAVSVETRVEFQYQLVLSDAIVLYDHYFDLRHPYTPSTKRHIVVPSRARTTRVPARERETVPTGNRTTRVP